MEIRFENEVYDLEIRGIRKLLHAEVDRVFYETIECPEDEGFQELEEIHALISARDAKALIDGYWLNGDINFFKVDNDELLPDALGLAGYKFEKSRVSRSLYTINDDGEEIRIADHKRPAIVDGNGIVVHEHEYQKEIIIDDNVVLGRVLQENGFSKLTKDEYLLG